MRQLNTKKALKNINKILGNKGSAQDSVQSCITHSLSGISSSMSKARKAGDGRIGSGFLITDVTTDSYTIGIGSGFTYGGDIVTTNVIMPIRWRGELVASPATPIQGDTYYNTVDTLYYIYSANAWTGYVVDWGKKVDTEIYINILEDKLESTPVKTVNNIYNQSDKNILSEDIYVLSTIPIITGNSIKVHDTNIDVVTGLAGQYGDTLSFKSVKSEKISGGIVRFSNATVDNITVTNTTTAEKKISTTSNIEVDGVLTATEIDADDIIVEGDVTLNGSAEFDDVNALDVNILEKGVVARITTDILKTETETLITDTIKFEQGVKTDNMFINEISSIETGSVTGDINLAVPGGYGVNSETGNIHVRNLYANQNESLPVGSIIMSNDTLFDNTKFIYLGRISAMATVGPTGNPAGYDISSHSISDSNGLLDLHTLIDGVYTSGPGTPPVGNVRLPNLINMSIIGPGDFSSGADNSSITTVNVGDTGGASNVTIQSAELPYHEHTFSPIGADSQASNTNPDSSWLDGNRQTDPKGGGSYHENKPPYKTLHFFIRY